MNTLLLLATNTDIFPAHAGGGGLKGLLITFLVALLILGIVICLIWVVEKYVHPIPDPGKLIIAIILVICIVIWAISNFL